MTAAIRFERSLCRQERRAPDRFAVADVEAPSALVVRNVVVPEPRNAPELCILIKTVAAAGVADQREEPVVPEIVDPGKRRVRPIDDIILCSVVEISVLHTITSSNDYLID